MKIGIISDTHDNVRQLVKAIDFFNRANVGLVIHCGDWIVAFTIAACKDLNAPIEGVCGNCDNRAEYYLYKLEHFFKDANVNITLHEQFLETERGGRKIAAIHGHDKELLDMIIASEKYDVVCSGHTHESKIEKKGKTLWVNPGSIVGYLGEHRDKHPSTVAVYDTEKGEATIVDLDQIN